LALAINSTNAGSSSPISKTASPRSSRSPEPRRKQKGKAMATTEALCAESEAAATSEPSDDDGEDEVEKDELEDGGEDIAATGAAAPKTYVSAICSSDKVSRSA